MTMPPNAPVPHSDPGVAAAEGGLVFLDGPDGVAVTMTAAAAAETGRSLVDAAEVAERQLEAKAAEGEARP